jgi:hypothetical protein
MDCKKKKTEKRDTEIAPKKLQLSKPTDTTYHSLERPGGALSEGTISFKHIPNQSLKELRALSIH